MGSINPTGLVSNAVPFDADYPYRLSEQGYDKLHVATAMLGLIGELAQGQQGSTVTLSADALSTVLLHLRDVVAGEA